MTASLPSASSASVRNILTLLASREAQLVAGGDGLERRVTWSCHMRARLPAFESIRGGEFALLTLSQLRRIGETLPRLLKSLHQEGVAAIAVAAPSREALGNDAIALANQLHLPLIQLPLSTLIEEIEREIITFVVNYRGEIERQAIELSHQLMQLSVQGVGIQGICENLAAAINKWIVVQNAYETLRLCVSPSPNQSFSLEDPTNEKALANYGLSRITAPIMIRYETVGYLAFIGREGELGYFERIVLGQVAPILALEVARERERTEVENRYQTEALMDVLQGNYQQIEEMQARARLLGYDLTSPQIVLLFEIGSNEPEMSHGSPQAQWSRRLREELIRLWPDAWISIDNHRLIALLPQREDGPEETGERQVFTRLERLLARAHIQTDHLPHISGGIGRIATDLALIPRSFLQAQQALEIGQKLFGDGRIHSFAHLGIYRLLFYLYGQEELNDFCQEMLGPLLENNSRGDHTLLETLEGFFRYNGNLSETARNMHLHRNSLLYRLGRIEELLGRSLEDAELRLSLQIALKIWKMQGH